MFPDHFKEATVIPIPKPGNLTKVNNYRPISLLPSPGKIIEKVVHNRLAGHLEKYEILNNHQYGFRKERSTTHAITELLNQLNLNLNKRTPTVALYIDFRKAFDCLQYPILITKLETLGLHKSIIDWIRDYLQNRIQRVRANSTLSEPGTMRQGVPQGSILGPLLYIIYANDIVNKIKKSKVTLYADDTVIYNSHRNINKAMANIQADLNGLTTWCHENGIYINPQKTKYMIFSSRNILEGEGRVQLKVDGENVERVKSYSYLGVTLDEHLTFDPHVKGIISKVSDKVFQLRKIRQYLTDRAALLVYKNMILPMIEYGDIYVSAASKENRKKLQVLQNKALKCALRKEQRYDTIALHNEAKLQPLRIRRKHHLLLHMFQLTKLPNYSGWRARTTTIKTRSSIKKQMKIRKPNLDKFLRSVTYQGPKQWNRLLVGLQKTEDYYLFKKKIITHLKPNPNDNIENPNP